MIEPFVRVAKRIRRELDELERTVSRAEHAVIAVQQGMENQDLYLDAAALNLHDFYTGLERIFHAIASTVDRRVPEGSGCTAIC